ncbi:hypothetical protein [Niallia sp. 03133]|uniref:hypothetical protein n=1 Tax=Niallia sp. 03133 TaxID=3458060 RepID=UPI00404513A8
MKNIIFSTLLACAIFITGCQNNTSQKNSDGNKSSQSNTEQTNEEKDAATSEDGAVNNMNTAQKNKPSTPKETISSVKNQLKMDGAILPYDFPLSKGTYLGAKIEENSPDAYKVSFYETAEKTAINDSSLESDKDASFLAAFTSKNKISDSQNDIFTPTANVDKIPNEMAVDLGHHIKGSIEGAAGHHYLAWREGRWILQIESLSEDKLDQVGIAKKMVEYLETHTLPIPHDEGRVKVNYKQGGEDVEVGIYWQDGNTLYQLETEEVPNNALMIAISVN